MVDNGGTDTIGWTGGVTIALPDRVKSGRVTGVGMTLAAGPPGNGTIGVGGAGGNCMIGTRSGSRCDTGGGADRAIVAGAGGKDAGTGGKDAGVGGKDGTGEEPIAVVPPNGVFTTESKPGGISAGFGSGFGTLVFGNGDFTTKEGGAAADTVEVDGIAGAGGVAGGLIGSDGNVGKAEVSGTLAISGGFVASTGLATSG